MEEDLLISGVIGSWEADPDEIINSINNLDGDIVIGLDSVGGSVIGGISIANAIRDYSKGSVTILGGAVVASIASYISAQADRLIIRDNTTYMLHNAWLPAIGDFNALRKSADLSEGLSTILAKEYAKRTGESQDLIQGLMNEETYFYGEEITANNFADEIIESKSDIKKNEAMAVATESLKACNNAIMQNEKLDYEAVAKLIPTNKDETKAKLDDIEEKRLDSLRAKHKRDLTLKLLKRK